MIKDLSDLEDILKEIKDEDFPLDNLKAAAKERVKDNETAASIEAQAEKPVQTASVVPQTSGIEQQWNDFLNILQSDVSKEKKDFHNVIRLDHDLAATLDECDIDGHSRSDLANAIIRAFVTAYLPRLAACRRNRVSLLDAVNPKEP